jgi:membrane-associated phospholipid phosphatase
MKMSSLILLFMFSFRIQSAEFLENIKQDAVSPFTTEALAIFEVGAGLTFLTYFLKKGSFQSDIAKNRPLGNSSKMGYFLGQAAPNIAYAVIMGGDYFFTHNETSLERSILVTKATLYSDAMTEILKRGVGEKRPNGNGTLSFPSGHATCAFAFSSVIMMEHSLPWGIAANTMAAFVGFSRMNDNAHYLHDVIAGATIGTMYGVGLYYAQRKREETRKSHSSVFMLLPTQDGLVGNFSLSY